MSCSLAALGDKRHELGSLSVIPPEIIGHIFSYLSSTDDAISFSVAHRLLSHEGFRRVVRLRWREYEPIGSWTGQRIITDEGGTDRSDLPAKCKLTAKEEKEMKKARSFYRQLEWWCIRMPRDAAWHTEMTAKRYGDIIKPALQRVAHSGTGDYLRVRLLVEDTSPQYTGKNKIWALCNHDRKQCIRASAVANWKITLPSGKVLQAPSSADGPFLRGEKVLFDLGSLAIILTAWSCYTDPVIEKGPWAGDRLGIYTVDNVSPKKLEDVSEWAMGIARDYVTKTYSRRHWF